MENKCKQCGKCCSTYIHLVGRELPEKSVCQLLEWRGVKLKMIDDLWFAIDNNAVCKHLVKKKNGKFECAIYNTRPDICRDYPSGWSNSFLNDGCGYRE